MNRAIIFMFNSVTPLSVNAIASCAKAISNDADTPIESMIAKQLDENDIAAAIASGIRVGGPEITIEKENDLTTQSVNTILEKFGDYIIGSNRDVTGFTAALSNYAAAAKFTGCDPAFLKSLRVLKNIEYNKRLTNMGLTKSACDVIRRVAEYV